MLRYRRTRSLQGFVSVRASVASHANSARSLPGRPFLKASRAAALAVWPGLGVAWAAATLPMPKSDRILPTDRDCVHPSGFGEAATRNPQFPVELSGSFRVRECTWYRSQ